jgi:hypothetical protein
LAEPEALARAWLDEPIPTLDGKSPRQAAGDPTMHGQLEELFKSIEYTEERRRQAGEPYIDIADIRHDLGLSRTTHETS